MKRITLLFFSLVTLACQSQNKDQNKQLNTVPFLHEKNAQIAEYVISAYEDSNGNLWFGTLSKGIAKYDGTELSYLTKKDGLPSERVLHVLEDKDGFLWFNTGQGISKYDGHSFTNFLVNDADFRSHSVSCSLIDSKGNFWIGTWGGVYLFDGKGFTPFELPTPQVSTPLNPDTKDWITDIVEDTEGNIWFARDGFGAYKYDGLSFKHYLKRDGLHANGVTDIEIDGDTIWFGTRVAEMDHPDPTKRFGKAGINILVDDKITAFPDVPGFNTDDVYSIFNDQVGHIWISTKSNGVYRYQNGTFKNYPVPISITGMCLDSRGQIWMAGAGGLYKVNTSDKLTNVTLKGPW